MSLLEKSYPAAQFRFCPFCGTSGFREKKVFCHVCSSCGRSFYTNSAAAVVAIITDKDSRVLVTVRKNNPAKGTLDLPGGFVTPGESVENALIREIKEELNLDIVSMEYFGSFPNRYLYDKLVYFTTDMVFICKAGDLSKLNAGDDVDSCRFMYVSDISEEEIGLFSIREIIKLYSGTK